MNMTYKGYKADVEIDQERKTFSARVADLNDIITFEGDSFESLQQAFADAVEDYLDWCIETGEEPERPYSGRVLVRMEPSLHREASRVAAKRGKSLNAFVVDALTAATEQGSKPPPAAREQAGSAAASELNQWFSKVIRLQRSADVTDLLVEWERAGNAGERRWARYGDYN